MRRTNTRKKRTIISLIFQPSPVAKFLSGLRAATRRSTLKHNYLYILIHQSMRFLSTEQCKHDISHILIFLLCTALRTFNCLPHLPLSSVTLGWDSSNHYPVEFPKNQIRRNEDLFIPLLWIKAIVLHNEHHIHIDTGTGGG